MSHHKKAIVVGAGIVGLAAARALALSGFKVTVIERNEKAIGASIRNFGMVWPIGQPEGQLYSRALRSKEIWMEIGNKSKFWYEEKGSLHLAYEQDEWQVLEELFEIFHKNGRPVKLLSPEYLNTYHGVNKINLLGGLFSETETIVDPREAIEKIPTFLEQQLGVEFIWGKAVTYVASNKISLDQKNMFADVICICSGSDFENLYPETFNSLEITKCKLQMLRFVNEANSPSIGTSLCGGLSLIHYNSFKVAPSLSKLYERYSDEMKEYIQWGIHVMVSQNGQGELTVGDSHEYGLTFDPFDKAHINELILDYLKKFAITHQWKQIQSWHGIYPKMTNREAGLFLETDPGVYIMNGMGGAGMTLSFGYAEEMINNL
jgi:FAD dependent oxidoreductase TIGR03364